MKLTNQTIIDTVVELNNLVEDSSTSLPATVSYAIIRNLRVLKPLAEDAEQVRLQLLEKYGSREVNEEDGLTYFSIPTDKTEVVNKELQALQEVENEVDLLTFSLDTLKDSSLSLKQMDTLYFMIDNGEG